MNGIKIIVGAVIALLMAAPAALCLASGSDALCLDSGTWMGNISANGRYVKGSSVTTVDLKNDIGIMNTELSWKRLDWRLDDRTHLRADYFDGSYLGDATRSQEVLIGGWFPRTVNYHLVSNMDLAYWKIGIVRYFHITPSSRWGMMLNINTATIGATARLSTTISGSTPVISEEAWYSRETAPTLGVVYETGSKHGTKGYVQISGLAFSGRPFFVDAEAGLSFPLGPGDAARILFGFRTIRFENSQNSHGSRLDGFTLAGPTFGIRGVF